MKLLYVVNQINGTTGQERILAVKTDYFIKKFGYDVTFLIVNESKQEKFFAFNSSIKFIYKPRVKNQFLSDLRQIIMIREVLEHEKPDIVVICIDQILGLYYPTFLNKKFNYIYERHNSKNVNLGKTPVTIIQKFKYLLREILLNNGGKGYQRFVLLSESHVAEWRKSKNIVVINNPIIFYPDEHAVLDNKRVLAVGRHAHQKGFDMLLKSWALVIKSHKDWILDIYGKKNENLTYLKLSKKYDIEDNINFHDPVSNIQDIYKEASIYALSSRFEGFPLVLIETMACGVPAVAFNCPHGVKELISHNEDGILVDPENVEEFANSLIYLMDNKNIRKEMGYKARKNILRLSAENIFPQWEKLFKELSN